MKASKYPWAAINITHADGSPIAGLGGTMMKEIAGLKVALVPVAQDTTHEVSSPGDWKFGDTVKTAIDGAKAARAAGADLVDRRRAGEPRLRPRDHGEPCLRRDHVGRRPRLHDRL